MYGPDICGSLKTRRWQRGSKHGFRVVSALGFRGLGFRRLGFRVEGLRGLGFWGVEEFRGLGLSAARFKS